ncbi:MAG: hypothetical protein LUQ18_02920 [Methylococcaceae bacterium]|nr:hypothetical protein [Methylococcaceae bacterium]
MVDFIEAFKEGQTAAEIAKKNNQEITSVLNELNKQINKATDGKIRISLSPEIIRLSDKPSLADLVGRGRWGRYIDAENSLIPNSPKKELVKWEQGREGYPCKITIGNKQHYCEDKTELENTLALMLQDPIVAETLTYLMSLSENKN